MSDQERNTGRTDDMDFSALDEELARIAEETPEVPEDFHDNWTRMIREEAAADKPETTGEKPRAGRGQMRYILSAAAAFVVLIGGVVLARNNGLLQGKTSAPEAPALMANALTSGEMPEEAEAVYEAAEAPAEQAGLLGMSADSMAASEPNLFSAEGTEARKADAAAAAQDSAPAPEPAMTASPTAPAVLMTAAGTAETGGESDAGTADAEEAAAETPEESAEEPNPETEEEDPQEEDSRSFLQKAWEGILNAVPWILGGAIIVLFILTRVVRPERKK